MDQVYAIHRDTKWVYFKFCSAPNPILLTSLNSLPVQLWDGVGEGVNQSGRRKVGKSGGQEKEEGIGVAIDIGGFIDAPVTIYTVFWCAVLQ